MPFLIIPLVLLSASVIEKPLYTDCSGDNYTVSSLFETNLKRMLDTLPSLTSPTGFNSTSAGVLQNKVYAKALCRGDVGSVGCQSCVENASREILKQCRTKTAIIWYQLCQVHYSFWNLVTTDGPYSGKYTKWNDQEKEISDPPRYKKAVADLLRDLSVEALSKPSKHMFQTGHVKFSKGETIYGLVQCTRDISGDVCFKCLQGASKELIDLGKQGGIMLSDNCNVRFELSRFYNVPGNRWKTRVIVYIVCASAIVLAILIGVSVICLRRRNRSKAEDDNSQKDLLRELEIPRMDTMKWKDDFASVDELPRVDLIAIRAATDNFSDENKLGRGGFGVVYKGVWQDGKEIAVKRLSRKSRQGLEEFKNEVTLIANLQHRNLVRLLGYGVEEEEKLLIYEFMHNKSLDNFVFDPEKRRGLDWRTYCNIIGGIARGLVYLHEDSRLKIIHRDLKPSNILLDHDMVAKISDFGIARIFAEDQNAANTRRAIGTYGYMAPEYAMEGRFSVKSDVFSFGIILLEIISGKRNSGFSHSEHAQTLLTYAWQLWSEGKELEIADPILLTDTSTIAKVVRCIHIGLLCVQKDPEDRPQMSSVVALLESEQQVVIPYPKQPEFDVSTIVSIDQASSDASSNHITISGLLPR